jgi:hypothetical protein
MADQPQSSRPPVARVLRESFISNFQEEGQEAALRLLDGLAYQLMPEGRSDYLMPEGGRDYITESDVLAAAGDLRQAADQLKESVQGLVEAGHDDREALRITVAVADASQPCSRSPTSSTPRWPPTSLRPPPTSPAVPAGVARRLFRCPGRNSISWLSKAHVKSDRDTRQRRPFVRRI